MRSCFFFFILFFSPIVYHRLPLSCLWQPFPFSVKGLFRQFMNEHSILFAASVITVLSK
jgi:hypothetical protein